MSDKHLPGLPLLDIFRPPPGWRVDRALLSTYSAEPAAIGAALLALAGRDDEKGSGSRVGLARALLELRGRVAIVLQRGRFAAPRRGGIAVRLLDRYVREVPWNEGRNEDGEGQSWHPKCAIIRMIAEDNKDVFWRFHLGSRNLTRDLSWDIGLRIEGRRNEDKGQAIPALAKVVQRLAEAASEQEPWTPLLRELRLARWDVPRGLAIRNIELMLPKDKRRSLPAEPQGISKLIAVSPFLDGGAVEEIAKWGTANTNRSLMSGRPALATLAQQRKRPLKTFDPLLILPATTESQEVRDDDEAPTDAAVDGRGLHAKFLWAEHYAGATLWLGSANLTMRGWKRNAEIVAEIAVERRGGASAARELEEGIVAFRDCGDEVKEEDLVRDVVGEDTELERLEEARRNVAANLDARQRVAPDGSVNIGGAAAPHPDDVEIELLIGPVAGTLTKRPRGQSEIVLGGTSEESPSELLVIRLELGRQAVSWTQVFPFDPPLGAARLDQRDATVLGNWLGARGMMAAIRDLLDGTGDGDGFGGDQWDAPDTPAVSKNGTARRVASADAPSLEQVLKAWMRDPQRLALVEQLLTAVPHTGDGPEEEAARAQLHSFRRTWATLRTSLEEGQHGS